MEILRMSLRFLTQILGWMEVPTIGPWRHWRKNMHLREYKGNRSWLQFGCVELEQSDPEQRVVWTPSVKV